MTHRNQLELDVRRLVPKVLDELGIPFPESGSRTRDLAEPGSDASARPSFYSRISTVLQIALRFLLVVAFVLGIVWLIANGADLLDGDRPSPTAPPVTDGTIGPPAPVAGHQTGTADSFLDQAQQAIHAGAPILACEWFAAAWQALPDARRARVDASAIAGAGRECRRDPDTGAALYRRALEPVTPSP